jgi:uncharacterized membrane protein
VRSNGGARPGDSDTVKEDHQEPIWTYRGYDMGASEFNTAMIHLYRGEINRANVWRQRLDATTNWAVVTTGATITFAFNQGLGHHSVIILNTLLVTLFLYVEARRYLYYELWSSRIRLMETDFFAAMLVPPYRPAADWAESLAENLLQPHHPISMWEGFGRRFRRNYMWIYIVMGLAWLARVVLLPQPVTSWAGFFARAGIGPVPGWGVMLTGLVFNGALMLIGLITVRLQEATGEVLPGYINDGEGRGYPQDLEATPRPQAWFRNSQRREQRMVLIITDNAHSVSDRILQEMNRGVTALSGKGMYTGDDHRVLLCALTVTELNLLKELVAEEDPHAFVILTPVQEILGEGFTPLNREGFTPYGR